MPDKREAMVDIDRVLAHAPGTGDEVDDFLIRRTMLVACAGRWAPPGSHYAQATSRAVAMFGHPDSDAERDLCAILRALRTDIEADQLRTFGQRVRADVFAGLLEQAEYLNGECFHRAACVLAGAVLEDHVKRLATRAGLALTNAKGGPQQASVLNDQLLAAGAYGKPAHAQVSSWQKSRNLAAHGDPVFDSTHTEADIRRMAEGIRDFLVKHPV